MALCLHGEEKMTKEIVVNGEESAITNTTSHFKVLNLRRSNDENARRKILKGTISPALLKLHDLRHLDLSNDQHRWNPSS